MKKSKYDIIGDIHGRADQLESLLKKLGYKKQGKGYAHPKGRKAVFLGDFINKGSENERVLEIVRRMVENEQAQAILGNHEFDAICYATKRKGKKCKDDFVCAHSSDNERKHDMFLSAFPFGSKKYKKAIAWLKTLPLFLEQDEFRAVHACWDAESVEALAPFLKKDNALRSKAYQEYAKGKGKIFDALEQMLVAPHVDKSDSGFVKEVSARPENTTKKEFARVAKLTFIGHFSLAPDHYEYTKRVAILDYKDRLTAYRWKSGQEKILKKNFVYSL